MRRGAAAIMVAFSFSGCAQHATRPETGALAPTEWNTTIRGAPVSAQSPRSRSRATSTPSSLSVEERLRAVQRLKTQGLINDQEADRKRSEILDDL